MAGPRTYRHAGEVNDNPDGIVGSSCHLHNQPNKAGFSCSALMHAKCHIQNTLKSGLVKSGLHRQRQIPHPNCVKMLSKTTTVATFSVVLNATCETAEAPKTRPSGGVRRLSSGMSSDPKRWKAGNVCVWYTHAKEPIRQGGAHAVWNRLLGHGGRRIPGLVWFACHSLGAAAGRDQGLRRQSTSH